ncbi:MAG: HesA/MoeB/ThiF family protein [Gammaproteobacteria bacterium]|jgi:adenylyltransferase/sulfurtransferase|nr:HesA/MoeB/ThiF family protein [Gammaproteobacteria bacterium]MDP6616174.1 HesA/MoeB/ThiF family protein [Gammaproteobacteria bacterium]MDP6695618.1 HesA/MoeB/ThiF family protein [Gammaproteobacteria bacterium]MDP7041091.1 HesA/MoeB/ThiF family protein [Gammaproteobacteria bacterium]
MNGKDIRYSRQASLAEVGEAGQQKLADSCALLIGAGGLGTAAGLYLATAGVGRLVINDFDTVDQTNLPRQVLYSDGDIDRPKAQVAADRLAVLNPHVTVKAVGGRLDHDALAEQVAAADIVLDCTDNFQSRWLINELCSEHKTALVTGAAIRTEGQLSLFRHDLGNGPCYRCLYSEEDENLNDCAGQGILGPVAGTIGCMMATEALKFLTGIESGLEGKLWVYDAKSGNSRIVAIPQLDDCPVCT